MLPFGILILYLSTTEILKHEYLKMKKSRKSESFHLLFLHRNNNSSCIFLSNNRHSLELRSQHTDRAVELEVKHCNKVFYLYCLSMHILFHIEFFVCQISFPGPFSILRSILYDFSGRNFLPKKLK